MELERLPPWGDALADEGPGGVLGGGGGACEALDDGSEGEGVDQDEGGAGGGGVGVDVHGASVGVRRH